jgi:hypothetical protein
VYNNSLSLLLKAVYSEYEWLPWKFAHTPHNYWDNQNNQRLFLNWAEKELNIKEKDDWYKILLKV